MSKGNIKMKKPGPRSIAIGGVLLSGVIASSTISARAATLSSLALRKNDVPAAYRQTKATSDSLKSAASAANVSTTTLRAKGWLADYDTGFTTGSTATLREIDSGITRFKSSQGARWNLNNGLRLGRQQLPHAKGFSVRGLGQQAAGITATGKSSSVTYTFVFIAFREGSYVSAVGITAGGKAQGPSAAEAEGYARIIDGRVKHA
jgi:hypothetical protein